MSLVDFDGPAIAARAAFAETVVYTSAGGLPVSAPAIFDQPFLNVDQLTGPSVSSSMPSVTIRVADWPQLPAQGDFVMARGNNFAIKEVRPDGQGMARLTLNAA